MTLILALDQGTTSSRAAFVDQNGAIVAITKREFPQIYPRPGLVEHNPIEIWNSLVAAIQELFEKHPPKEEIAAIGISNQRETCLLWDRETLEPVGNAIVWQDRRTAPRCDALREEGKEEMIHKITGLRLDPYFSGTKLEYLFETHKGRNLCCGTIDSWLIAKLSAGKSFTTDWTNASRTLLFDIEKLTWSSELCSLFSVPQTALASPLPSISNFGTATLPGLFDAIPIGGVAGDQQAATFGQCCFTPGMAKVTYGTGAFVLLNIGEKRKTETSLLTTLLCCREKAIYALEGSLFTTGALITWLVEGLEMISTPSELEEIALDSSDGVYFVPALSGLGAPYWNPYARGMLLGLTRGTKKGHIARAALEGIAFRVTDVLKVMQRDEKLSLLRADGGSAKSDLLLQIQSDFLQIPVERPKQTELSIVGAAFLAGLSSGVWKNHEELEKLWERDKLFSPTLSFDSAQEKYTSWIKALETAIHWRASL